MFVGFDPKPMIPESLSINRRLLSGGAWAFAGKLFVVAATFVVNALLARLLSPEEMGAYFLIFSLSAVSALAAQLGLNQIVVRRVAESVGMGRPGQARTMIAAALGYTALGVAGVIMVLLFGLGEWAATQIFRSSLMAAALGWTTGWIAVLAFQSLIAESFRGFHDIRSATLFGGVLPSGLALSFFFLLWILRDQASLKEVLFFCVLSGAAGSLVGGLFLWRRLRGLEKEAGPKKAGILKAGWALLLTNLTMFALTQADIWILGAFRPADEVAVYGAASRLAALVTASLIIVNSVIPPIIAEMHAQGRIGELQRVLQRTATLTSIPALFAAGAFILFGGPIMGVLFGGPYRDGAVVLAWLSLGQIMNVLAGSCGFTLIMTGYEKVMMGITVFSGVLMVIGATWAVRTFGLPGVAGMAALTMMLQNLLMGFFAWKKTGIRTYATFFIPSLR